MSANTALGWLWGTSAAQRLARLTVLPNPVVFVDVETTRDRIVEVATVRFERGQLPSVFHTYVNPGIDGWRRSGEYWNTRIHGLTPDQVRAFPPFSALLPALAQQFAGGAVAVGHNVSFERRFLEQEHARLGQSWSSSELCTLRLARQIYPARRDDGGSFKLDALAAGHDLRNPAPHRAIGDTVTTVWLLLAMLEPRAQDPHLEEWIRESCRGLRPPNPWTS